MQQKKSISAPKRGMVRDKHISNLTQTDYTFAYNANVESEDGDILNISNESSNYLGLVLPEGYKIIGNRKDGVRGITYLFLTNPQTRKSSIGYVDDTLVEYYNDDEQCEGCGKGNKLAQGLENIEQTPSHTYTEYINDDCHIDNGEEGLNFDINFPIKNIEIKHEKGATTLYWNDFRNEPRWMNVSDLRYLFTQSVPCDDDQVLECFDVYRLLQFPKHTNIDIQPELLQIGGSLKLGVYEFYAVYCDVLGNEATNYSTPTNPISLFDENNVILSQPELDSPTNFAIKLKVNNLDTRFDYYKVVVAQRTNVNNTQSYFVVGIQPTTDDVVLYTSETNKERTTPDRLFAIKTQYEKAKGLVSSDGFLYQWGLQAKREVNLQPIANIIGGFVQWQSSIGKETLFKSAIATSKYKGYSRNEVQPFAIRFLFKDGGYTANFPLVPRPATDFEKEILTDDPNLESILEYAPNCTSSDRERRWQIYNTAIQEEVCPGSETGGLEVIETVQKQCTIEDVYTIEAGTASFELEDEFISLQQYLEDNPDAVIDGITEHLIEEYPDDNCLPTFGTIYTSGTLTVGATYIIYEILGDDDFDNTGFTILGEPFVAEEAEPNSWEDSTEVLKTLCSEPTLVSNTNSIGVVENEVYSLIEVEFPEDYAKLPKPNYCYIYKIGGDGNPERDPEFEILYMFREEDFGINFYNRAYKREYTFTNEDCSFADDIVNLSEVETTLQGYFHNYIGAEDKVDLQTSKTATEVDEPNGFTNKIHKGALWFKGAVQDREKFILEISQQNDPSGDDDIITSAINPDQKVRMSIFDKCSSSTPLYSEIISLETGQGIQLLISDLTPTGFNVDNGTTTTAVASPITGGTFFVVVDNPIYEVQGKDTYDGEDDDGQGGTIITKYRTAPTDGCWSIATRNVQYSSATVSWDSIRVDKTQVYESDCSFIIPDVADCDPVPYAKGKFSYWESTREYPDNKELYDSTRLRIREEDLADLSENQKDFFEEFYTTDLVNNYILKDTLDLTCKPIRHYKFPDNTVSPFMLDTPLPSFSEAYIFPLGITLDNKVVDTFLKVAVNNGLLTQKEYDNIEGYEILKGDNTINKSVIANGLGFDMYKYTEKGKDVFYANYPHNDLGDDELHYADNTRTGFIPHPFDGDGNNKFSFISPDLILNKTTNPTEVILSGYETGNSLSFFSEVENHPKWTILGDKARRLAFRLAQAESFLEANVKAAEILSNQFFMVGFANGFSLGLVGSIVASVAFGIQSFMKIGQYRYQWLQIFRDSGSLNNFASYHYSEGFHNRFLKNQDSDNYLRGITSLKHLKDAKRYSIRDEKTGEDVRVNSFLREYSTFLSLGDFPFNYSEDYKSVDNNKKDKDRSSRTIASATSCEGEESLRNVGAPYFTLKNYIPDQYGDIDSIKWLTTNYKNKLEDSSDCMTIFGGNVCISRFDYKRKIPMFSQNAFQLADKLAFNYYDYKNVGFPRFYCDYETDGEFKIVGIPFPDISSAYNFDCVTSSNRMYIRKPSKFYLWYYGISNFLVESEINCNFRYAGRQPKDQFASYYGDLGEWTQEKNVSIKEPNAFFYNNVYSLPVSNTPYKILNKTYNEEFAEIQRKLENGVIRSQKDTTQANLTDPWLINKPLDFNELEKKHGTLTRLVDVGSGQIMAIFENNMLVFGAIDTVQKSLNNSQTQIVGTGDIFNQRVLELKTTDLGFAGSQHNEVVNTPYGHFYVDAKRGKVFLYEGGNNLNTISESAGKEPTYMKNWFKEHLPFKILKNYSNIPTDNKFKGIGISLGWDERFDRVFLTKKDYITKNTECLKYAEDIGFYTQCNEGCEEGIDLVFVIDATGSQQNAIDNIKDNILTNILPAIVEKFGENYRLGLIAVKDRRVAGQSLFDILTPMEEANVDTFTADITTVVATGGANTPEPTDKALEAVINNTQEIDLNGDVVASDTIGVFRDDVAKAVILITDNTPSGLDDNYTYEDWLNVVSITDDYDSQSIQIFPFLTSPVQASAIPPNTIDELPPNVTYVMQYYASATNGVYTFSSLGNNISDDVVTVIEENIACTTEERIPVYFDNEDYFEDVSWTIAYKITDGTWGSYFSFKPDVYFSNNDHFRIGFNYGRDAETIWNHNLNKTSFQVFQGRLEPFIIEFPVINENATKILNSISVNLEAKRYNNQWDYSIHKDVGMDNMFIWNQTNNSGYLVLHPQKTLADNKNYPKTEGNKQHILTTFTEGKQNVNSFFNRITDDKANISTFKRDINNILKEIDPRAVSFKGKRVLERISGEVFLINMSNTKTSQFNLLIKTIINEEIITE